MSDKKTIEDKRQRDLDQYIQRIDHEDGLVDGRLNWLLASQTIFAALIIGPELFTVKPADHLGGELTPLILAVSMIAILTCVMNYISIMAALIAINKLCARFYKKYKYKDSFRWLLVGSMRTHLLGLIAPMLVPMVFLGFWIWILMYELLGPRYIGEDPELFHTSLILVMVTLPPIVYVSIISWWRSVPNKLRTMLTLLDD